jgi:thiamine biosynthesis lipoprotein
VFEDVERACTRFDPTSPLMRANADPDSWHQVPAGLFRAVAAAARAHEETDGLFDPRVLRTLESFGYDRSLPFAAGPVVTPQSPGQGTASGRPAAARWQPKFGADGCSVLLGPEPIDLGGIGKGLAVRWAAECLVGAGRSVLVEAGGDCSVAGPGPDGDGWKVGVEDPLGGPDPVAVLSVINVACATSSVRLRRWRSGGQDVHHLIDPRTGKPGGPGLVAVTVVGDDAAQAEVWSKSLFLAGVDGVRGLAEARGLPALWVGDDGSVGTTEAMDEYVVWRASRAC